MYKILLADEEGISLRSLRVMIRSQYNDETDIRLATNARQTLDIYAKFCPDLVFINMQMPGIRGLSTLRDFHVQNPMCQFIVISYRGRLDYGREGKNLGIYAYTPKPFKSDLVKTQLKNCLAHIDMEQKRDEITRYNRQKWNEAVPMIEGGMISEVLFPNQDESHVSVYKDFLNITQDYGWICTLKYSQINEHGTMINPMGSVVILSNKYLYFRTVVKAFFPSAIVGPILANQVVFLVPCEEEALTKEQLAARKKRVDDLTYQLHRKLDLRFKSTLGDPIKLM